jgi:hypothetical protein
MISLFAAATIALGTWIHVPGGTWVPSSKTVHAAASKLEQAVKEQAGSEHRSLSKWSGYTFQYQGRTLQVQGHEHKRVKVIFVYGFCPQPQAVREWLAKHAHEEFLLVNDGGTCYFRAYYDPATKKYLGIIFNGMA